MTSKILIDGFKVTPDVATELMVHHLIIAARLFEVSPDHPDTRKEVIRLFDEQDDPRDWPPEKKAGLQWFDEITAIFEKMKDDD